MSSMIQDKDEHRQLGISKKILSRSSDDVSKMICNLLRQQSAPDVEIDTFKGDPLEYHYFMSVLQKL